MNEVLKNIYARASVRRYKADKVPERDIEEILRAGFHAANGMNRQAIEFVVIENKDVIGRYNRKAITLYAEAVKAAGGSNPMVEKMADDPKSDIFYGAPVLVFVYANPSAVTPVEDGSLAVGNMMLAARSMGYGTCFIGFASSLGNDKEFMEECNVPGGYRYIACMILGKPEGEIEKHSRSDVKILKWVE